MISAADVGRNIVDLLPPEVARQRLDAAEAVLQSGQMQVFEFPLQVGEELLWEEVRIFSPEPERSGHHHSRSLPAAADGNGPVAKRSPLPSVSGNRQRGAFFVFETETAQYSYLNPAILDLTGVPVGPSPG